MRLKLFSESTRRCTIPFILAFGLAGSFAPIAGYSDTLPAGSSVESRNGDGVSRTISTAGKFNLNNPFFKKLGTNGRTCATCHVLSQGLEITPDYVQSLFDATQGLDPLFAAVDGTNSPSADMSTPDARRANTTMLVSKGLIRVGFKLPANAEFTIDSIDDPYGYSHNGDVSCFRRPLPATNLRFLANVMWDGRESRGDRSKRQALSSQVRDAVAGHMQGVTPPTDDEVTQIVDFETHLFTTQIYDDNAGVLNEAPILGGPMRLATVPYFRGINQFFNFNGVKAHFDKNVFYLYESWLNDNRKLGVREAARLSAARGEKIFNTKRFVISGVAGLNDIIHNTPSVRSRFAVSNTSTRVVGTCSSCHNTPSVGSNSLPLLLNTGVSDGSLRTPDLPLYTLRNKSTNATIQTTDPGAAMSSGKWADIGKFKVPRLRGLETQSPYMHNGFSGELLDIINFYNTRFNIGLTTPEKNDLKAFLKTL